tara:strand:- start:1543 stop:1836 length:294 start_codon:yes stop_codon:yes gene_type:complete
MENYITHMEFASTLVKGCGAADTDMIKIMVGSHDIQIQMYNTASSIAFQAECVDRFTMKLIGTKAHCTQGKMYITNTWVGEPDNGRFVVEFILCECD